MNRTDRPRPFESLSKRLFAAVNQVVEPALQLGFGNPLPLGIGLVVVETTGRRTGQARPVPLVAARAGDRLVVSTVRPRSQWAKNLEAEPRARVRLWGRSREATATVRSGVVTTAQLDLGEGEAS